MLELPEVEVLRKDLEKEIVGKRVKDVTIQTASLVKPYHRTRPEFIKLLEGRKIEGARRRGTTIFLDLDEDLTFVLQAYGTSSVHRETASEEPGADTHLVVTFTIGGAIHLSDHDSDPNANVGIVATEDAMSEAKVDPSAFDPLEDNLTWMEFDTLLREASTGLKAFLMDDKIILGLGPVYSDEVLYEAGLRWDRPSDQLSTQEVRRLYRAIHEVIATAMKFRGSSLDDDTGDEIVDEDGEASEHLKVYGRHGLPSFRSRKIIVREKAKRGMWTYYDPQSQY